MAHAQLNEQSEHLVLNVFPVALPPGTTFTTRVWTIDPIPTTDKLREKIRSFLWKSKLHRPVFPYYVEKNYCYMVADWGKQEPVDYIGDGERRYTIAPTEQQHVISLDNMSATNADIAAAMLQQEISLHLRNHADLVQGQQSTQFFLANPDSPYQPKSERRAQHPRRETRATVDIYRGFNFRVMYLEDFGLCVVLDLLTSYIGHDTLANYLARDERPRDLDTDHGLERWVNDYGRKWQSVYLLSAQNKTIDDVVLREGPTTYSYLHERYPSVRDRIKPTDRAATIIYRADDKNNESKHYTAAASLLRPKFTLQHPAVRNLNDTPAFDPDERLRRIKELRQYFKDLRFGGKLATLHEAVQIPYNLLPLPELIFGSSEQPTVLKTPVAQTESETRRRLDTAKLPMLRDHGPYRPKAFINPCFVYPASFEDNRLFEQFITQTKDFCATYGRATFEPAYESYRDHAHPRDIITKVQGLNKAGRTGFILLALPTNVEHATQVYVAVKSTIPLPSKCFSTAKFLKQPEQKRSSYIQRNALGMLVENGACPWGLQPSLTYELQFGFDVARTRKESLMGVAVISDPSCSDIVFGYKEMPKAERIPPRIIGPFIIEHLNRFVANYGRTPHNILFQRDGRLFEDELKGIRQALQRFAKEHPNQPTPNWAAITIEKSTSVPLRLFLAKNRQISRVFSGNYVLQSTKAGYIILAGAPSLRQGTPRPLRVELIAHSQDHNANIVAILRDIFWLSRLNWNSPDIDIRLPITLRFTDQKLERYALELDEDTQDDWDDEEDDIEP